MGLILQIISEERNRQKDFLKVLDVIRSVSTKDQYYTSIEYANNFIKKYQVRQQEKDWETINKLLTLIKIKVRIK
jgi:hypothetical protein